jgi:hypothetical protein
MLGFMALFAGCASESPESSHSQIKPADARALIEQLVPPSAHDSDGWVTDIYAGFNTQNIEPTHGNVCAVVAVIEQESSFRVDPVIPGLGAIARREIDSRAQHAGIPLMLVHTALDLKSSDGKSYGERIDHAKTEHELSDSFEDFIGRVPMGHTLFEDRNPIRTRGPMQVNVAFVKEYASVRPYPYPVKVSIEDEVFTRRGGLYFGIAHLLAYSPPYDNYLYRFADFNAGQFSSRNAAFQSAVSAATGIALARDGALLPHETGKGPGDTELAIRTLGNRLDLDEGQIHSALEKSRTKEFERTKLYERVFTLAERRQGHALPRELLPRIKLHGPKISRNLSTEWYAKRVDGRFKQCLAR